MEMGKFWTQMKVCILLFCALPWTLGAAERLFFLQSSSVTWVEARSHCQACFKDLVTLTPENIQVIVRDLSSDYWVGLRENFTSTVDPSGFWSRWANGDPLTFQNWLPGQPVFKSHLPKTKCCSCACTCPAKPTTVSFTMATSSGQTGTGSTGITDVTGVTAHTHTNTTPGTTTPVASECVRTPLELPDDDFDPDKDYIEDACVVMLRFGAWVEKNCSERLPYICYDDRFDGQAQATNITSTSATVVWEEGPGDITHYRGEVRTGKQRADAMATNVMRNFTTNNLHHLLNDLTAGAQYLVQVFAVKCGRDLNPQNATFSTIPNRVKNLNVTHVTDTSISLSWKKPDGNADIYIIESQSLTKPLQVTKEHVNISNLVPGTPYTFSVYTGVRDASKRSNEVTISAYTRPQRVSNLRVSENDDSSMLLEWDLLAGNNSGFLVAVSWNGVLNRSIDVNQNTRNVRVEPLPSGTAIKLGVRALANNNTLPGEESTVVNYTAPQRTSMLTLNTTATTLIATWEYPEGNDYSFYAELRLNNIPVDSKTTSDVSHRFEGLKTATNYSVFVYSVSGHRRSRPVTEWIFTLPQKPVNVRAANQTKNQITIQWSPPENAGTFSFRIRLASAFYGQIQNRSVYNKTSVTFGNLTSGTKYNFEVRTTAGTLESEAVSESHYTDTDEREVILAMVCSSETPLHCDQDETRTYVFDQLKSHLNKLLGDSVAWKLKKLEQANAKT